MQSVIERVALEVKRLHAQLIEKIKLARATLVAEERRVGDYVAFNGEGKGIRPRAPPPGECGAPAVPRAGARAPPPPA